MRANKWTLQRLKSGYVQQVAEALELLGESTFPSSTYCHLFNNIISLQILQLKNSECFPFGIWKVLASKAVFAGLVYNYVEIYSHLCVGCYIYIYIPYYIVITSKYKLASGKTFTISHESNLTISMLGKHLTRDKTFTCKQLHPKPSCLIRIIRSSRRNWNSKRRTPSWRSTAKKKRVEDVRCYGFSVRWTIIDVVSRSYCMNNFLYHRHSILVVLILCIRL